MLNIFIIVRILDILTTLYGINHGQFEFNLFNNLLLQQSIFIFLGFHAFMIWLVVKTYHFRLIRLTINIFTFINLLIVLMNIILILLVLFKV